MGAKAALFFLLDSSKASVPQNYGMQLPVQKVAPFYDSLNSSSRFAKMSFPESTVYGLSYFKKPANVDILVVVRELENFSRQTLEEQCRAQLGRMLKTEEHFFHAEYLHRALWLPRGLQKQEFLNLLTLFSGQSDPHLDGVSRLDAEDYWVMNWSRGFIFGGRNEMDFSRSLALYGLALAYHRVHGDSLNRLSQALDKDMTALPQLRLQAARFDALYYFANPVLPAYEDSARVFAHLARNLHLERLHAQLSDKLGALDRLLELQGGRAGGERGLGDFFRSPQDQSKPAAQAPALGRAEMPPTPRRTQPEGSARRSSFGKRLALGVGALLVLAGLGYWLLPPDSLAQWLSLVPS